jgi:hypothetical protein
MPGAWIGVSEIGRGEEDLVGRYRRWVLRIGIGIAAVLILIQLIPDERSHTNPPTTREPVVSSARTMRAFTQVLTKPVNPRAECWTSLV